MTKIHVGNKAIFLCEASANDWEAIAEKKGTKVFKDVKPDDFALVLSSLRDEEVQNALCVNEKLLELESDFFDMYTIIEAGGGFVSNENGEVLFIFRRGFWDLPKGKLDDGETIAECALREVKEETGLQNVQLQEFMGSTFHIYTQEGEAILKESFWYTMRADSTELLTPQTSEDITEIRWVPLVEIPKLLENSFGSIKDVAEWANRFSEVQ